MRHHCTVIRKLALLKTSAHKFDNAKLCTIIDPCMVNRASTKFQLLCWQLISDLLLMGPCHSSASSAWPASASQIFSSNISHRSVQEGQSHSRSDGHQISVGEPDTAGADLRKLRDQRSQQLHHMSLCLHRILFTALLATGSHSASRCAQQVSTACRLEPVLLVAERLQAAGS